MRGDQSRGDMREWELARLSEWVVGFGRSEEAKLPEEAGQPPARVRRSGGCSGRGDGLFSNSSSSLLSFPGKSALLNSSYVSCLEQSGTCGTYETYTLFQIEEPEEKGSYSDEEGMAFCFNLLTASCAIDLKPELLLCFAASFILSLVLQEGRGKGINGLRNRAIMDDSLSEMPSPTATTRSPEEQDLLQRSTKKSKRNRVSMEDNTQVPPEAIGQETPQAEGLMSPDSWFAMLEELDESEAGLLQDAMGSSPVNNTTSAPLPRIRTSQHQGNMD
nr:uncharacterized protein LOC109175269 [Ipomoea batatas]